MTVTTSAMLIGLRQRVLIVCGLFLSFVLLLFIIYCNFPELEEEHRELFKYPRSLEDAKGLGRVLLHYKEQHMFTVLFGVVVVYIMLQSFAVPVCFCSATGASVCYLLSYMLGRDLVTAYFPERIKQWQGDIAKHRSNLLSYIIFLRVTPFLPNWFINIASPVLNVPIFHFYVGTFLGVAPPSFLYIQAGSTLEQMVHTNVTWNLNSVLLLTFSALLSLVPVLWSRCKSKRD